MKIEVTKYDKNDYLSEEEKIANELENRFNKEFNENIEIVFFENENLFKIYNNEKFIQSDENFDYYDLVKIFEK